MKGLVAGSAVLLALTVACRAADLSITTTSEAGQIGNYDWAGAYVGAELGYAAGPSDWSAVQTGAASPISAGSLDILQGFNAFKGTGSYFGGFEAGYNYVFPSRLVLGVEGDLSFPNDISGNQTVSSLSTGQANYSDTVLLFGTARGRIGYAFDKWLVYGTGGFAFSRDQLNRTQLGGTPIGGTAVAGDVDTELLTRLGATIGAGVEVGLTPRLSAKLEYRFFDFPSSGVFFPPAAQHYDSDLMLHSVQLGLNYKLRNPGDDQLDSAEAQSASNNWAIHGQTTYVYQYDPPFQSPYIGPQSLKPDQRKDWSIGTTSRLPRITREPRWSHSVSWREIVVS